jgi:2-dehydropantoate 2-reductase
MRVLIAGTGGVGGYFGARLQQAGNDVWFLARGDNLAALRERGLRLRSDFGDADLSPVRAVADAAEVGKHVDAVLFCVKAYDNDTAIPLVRQLLDQGAPGALVLSLQNGVSSPYALADAVGEARVLAGPTYVEGWKEAPGEFHQRGPNNKLVVGALRAEGGRPSTPSRRRSPAPCRLRGGGRHRVATLVQADGHLLRRRHHRVLPLPHRRRPC